MSNHYRLSKDDINNITYALDELRNRNRRLEQAQDCSAPEAKQHADELHALARRLLSAQQQMEACL